MQIKDYATLRARGMIHIAPVNEEVATLTVYRYNEIGDLVASERGDLTLPQIDGIVADLQTQIDAWHELRRDISAALTERRTITVTAPVSVFNLTDRPGEAEQ